MKFPHMVHWHEQYRHIGDDIGHSVADEDASEVETSTRNRRVPSAGNRLTLEYADENEHQGPDHSQGTENPGSDPETR